MNIIICIGTTLLMFKFKMNVKIRDTPLSTRYGKRHRPIIECITYVELSQWPRDPI